MNLTFSIAGPAEAPALAALHNAVSEDLTRRYGPGPWSYVAIERGAPLDSRLARVVVAKQGGSIVGALRLQTKKPWAIDISCFTPVKKAIYLINMAVIPSEQHKGIGRMLLKEASNQVKAWPADAIRLDAFDSEGGAGGFYSSCGLSTRGRVVYRKAHLIYFELLV